MRKYQTGTLYELYFIGLLLAVVGIVLSSKHPAFLVLTAIGVGLPFLPSILELRDVLRSSARAKKHWKDLCMQGFKPAAVVRARMREGGAYVAVDIDAGKVAFITSENSQLMDLADIKEVSLTSGTVNQWGKPDVTRYGFQFVPKGDANRFGLSFPKKSKAVKAFNSLRKVLDGRVTFVE